MLAEAKRTAPVQAQLLEGLAHGLQTEALLIHGGSTQAARSLSQARRRLCCEERQRSLHMQASSSGKLISPCLRPGKQLQFACCPCFQQPNLSGMFPVHTRGLGLLRLPQMLLHHVTSPCLTRRQGAHRSHLMGEGSHKKTLNLI